MITARLESENGSQGSSFGPYRAFIILGNTLQLPGGKQVAAFYDGRWRSGGRQYHAATISGTACVTFGGEDCLTREIFGPYLQLRIVDGAIWAGISPSKVLVRYDQKRAGWQLPNGEEMASHILLHAAG